MLQNISVCIGLLFIFISGSSLWSMFGNSCSLVTTPKLKHNIRQRRWPMIIPYFTTGLWTFNKNLMKMIFYSNFSNKDPIMSQFCTCHDSWAVMACAKLWHDLMIIFHVRATCIVKRFWLWVCKSFVWWPQIIPCLTNKVTTSAVISGHDTWIVQ